MSDKKDIRVGSIVAFALASGFLILLINLLRTLGVVPPPLLNEWPLLDRIQAVLTCTALGASCVLGSVFWGIKHFGLFSQVDRVLTRVPVGLIGVALVFLGGYILLTKSYNYHRGLLGLSDGAALLLGSFLCFWVCLFYGRDKSQTPTTASPP